MNNLNKSLVLWSGGCIVVDFQHYKCPLFLKMAFAQRTKTAYLANVQQRVYLELHSPRTSNSIKPYHIVPTTSNLHK